jgi:hypothetical protein
MTHAEFVAAWREGRLRVEVDRKAAARAVSARLMLPFVLLPMMGAGVALALVGRYLIGAAVFLAAFGLRFAVRRSAAGFVLQRALASVQDAAHQTGTRTTTAWRTTGRRALHPIRARVFEDPGCPLSAGTGYWPGRRCG